MSDAQEWHDYYRLFELENHAPDWPLYKSPEAVVLLRSKAESYKGLPSISHYLRAFSELKDSGSISQLRQPKPAEADEPELTPEAYHKLSAREVARRYMQKDSDFKIQVDSLISRGLIVWVLYISFSGVFQCIHL